MSQARGAERHSCSAGSSAQKPPAPLRCFYRRCEDSQRARHRLTRPLRILKITALKSTLFIVNPASSFGKTLRRWNQVRELIAGRGIDFDEHLTSRAGEAIHVAAEAFRAGVSQVVAVGGDGTLSEVVNGYLQVDGSPINAGARVALLPSGTGSDFRRSLGLAGIGRFDQRDRRFRVADAGRRPHRFR